MIDVSIAVVIAQSQCDPAYPSDVEGNPVCLPPPPPDIDCSDLREAGAVLPVRVLEPDPHPSPSRSRRWGCEAGVEG